MQLGFVTYLCSTEKIALSVPYPFIARSLPVRGVDSPNLKCTVKTVHNVARDLKLRAKGRLHSDDYISTCAALDRLRRRYASFPDKCIVGDFPGEAIVEGFVIIMTPYQALKLRQHGKRGICIDSTHQMTTWDHYLTTLMVYDEQKHGVPVAFCISKNKDTSTWERFFTEVKAVVGVVKPKFFLSDADHSLYNGWVQVMGQPLSRRLCEWHVKKRWNLKLGQLHFDETDRETISETLTAMMEESDTTR